MKVVTGIVLVIAILGAVLSPAVAVGLTAVLIVGLFVIFGKAY